MDNLDNSLFISLNESQIRKSNNNLKFSTNYSEDYEDEEDE